MPSAGCFSAVRAASWSTSQRSSIVADRLPCRPQRHWNRACGSPRRRWPDRSAAACGDRSSSAADAAEPKDCSATGPAAWPRGTPNLFGHAEIVHARPLAAAGLTVNRKAPPSVELPPRAFQYMSATGVKRGSSAARLASVASMACFSEQIRPIETSPFLEGEHLRPQHGRVGDAQQLERFRFRQAAGDDEEPGAVGRGVDVRRLDLPVDPLLLGRQAVEVQLGRRRQGLDDVLERIVVDPVPQIEQQHRDFGVGEELREDVAAGQVFAHRVIVGEVAVVDQGLVQPDERMGAAGMPDAALGGIALVGDPDVGPRVGHAVILHGRLGKAHDLQDDQVPARATCTKARLSPSEA